MKPDQTLRFLLALPFLLAALAPACLRADDTAVLSNLGESADFQGPIGQNEGAELAGQSFITGTAQLTLGSITISLAQPDAEPLSGPLVVSVYGNDDTTTPGQDQPGSLLADFTPTDSLPDPTPATTGTFTFSDNSGLTLSATTTYWIVLSTTSVNDYQPNYTDSASLTTQADGWSLNSNYATALYFSGSWFVSGPEDGNLLFSLGASTVPEPASLALAGFGLLALGAVGMRKLRRGAPSLRSI